MLVRLFLAAASNSGFCAFTAVASLATAFVSITVGGGAPVVVPVAVTVVLVGGENKLDNDFAKLLIPVSALSINGTPVGCNVAKPPAFNVESGNCGIPSRARIYGSVGSAPPRS